MLVPFLLAVDFMNFTYAVKPNPCGANQTTALVMRKGTFSYKDPQPTSDAEYATFVRGVTEGTLVTRQKHAVVVISCDYPADGGAAGAYLYAETKAGATLVARVGSASWGTDWGAGPQSIHVRFQKNLLYVDQCKNIDCTLNVVTTYAIKNGNLTKVYIETHKRKD